MEKEQVIGYVIGKSTLGAVLMAESERGVCAIALGDGIARLVEELRQRFPGARLVSGAVQAEYVQKVAALVASPGSRLDLPLDLRGSDLHKRVWQALREIPAGTTQSYAEVAARTGATAKEVGEACAANALAVAIPCHRVVRKDGGVAGYRWGVKRKIALLRLE